MIALADCGRRKTYRERRLEILLLTDGAFSKERYTKLFIRWGKVFGWRDDTMQGG